VEVELLDNLADQGFGAVVKRCSHCIGNIAPIGRSAGDTLYCRIDFARNLISESGSPGALAGGS